MWLRFARRDRYMLVSTIRPGQDFPSMSTIIDSAAVRTNCASPRSCLCDEAMRDESAVPRERLLRLHVQLPNAGPNLICRVGMWRVGLRSSLRVAAPFVWRCLSGSTVAPFPHPLIEPDMRRYRIRLSDKTSRLRPRRAASKPSKAYEPEVAVPVLERIDSALAPSRLVFIPQPSAQPHRRVIVDRTVRFDG